MLNQGDWKFMKHKPEYARAIRKAVLMYERQEEEKKRKEEVKP